MRWLGRVRGACAGALVLGLALGAVGAVPSTATAQADDPLAAAATLAGYIPQDVRYQCSIDTTPAPSSYGPGTASIRVGLYCPGADGVNYVEYYLFSNSAAMNSVYTTVVGDNGSRPVRSAEGNCPSDTTWNFSGQTAGRVGCYYVTSSVDTTTGQQTTTPEYVVRMWTDDAAGILGVAAMAPGNDDAVALQTWWNKKAGPLKTADTGTGALTSTSGQAQAERALLSHIPAATRKSCKQVDVSDTTNQDYFPRRLWLRAVVDCRPGGGADAVVYELLTPASVDGYFAYWAATAAAQQTAKSSTCPDTGTVSQGTGKKASTTGEYACLIRTSTGYNNDAPYAEYVWTHHKLGIMSQAFNLANNPAALIKWFDSAASGPA